jgi:hypothetical protein
VRGRVRSALLKVDHYRLSVLNRRAPGMHWGRFVSACVTADFLSHGHKKRFYQYGSGVSTLNPS